MSTKMLKLVAAIAWAGVGIASAAPADATAMTSTTGGAYASCSSNSLAGGNYASCPDGYSWNFDYTQTIKFISTPCNSGACVGTATTWVDFVYTAGRKTATTVDYCGSWIVYELGACAC